MHKGPRAIDWVRILYIHVRANFRISDPPTLYAHLKRHHGIIALACANLSASPPPPVVTHAVSVLSLRYYISYKTTLTCGVDLFTLL